MIKYYLSEIITFSDGTKDSPAIYIYDSETDAVSRFHKELGGWIGKDNVKSVLVLVVDFYGNVIKNETWFATEEQ